MNSKMSKVRKKIQSKIFMIRKKQVMLDSDLAELYEVPTKVLNQAVKRNKERFPEEFMFQITKKEKTELVTNCDHLQQIKYSPYKSAAFTEQGVTMLSSILKSKTAIKISIQIINSFVEMRRFIKSNDNLFQRISFVEQKILEQDNSIHNIFSILKNYEPEKDIFFEGELFDAQVFISKIIKKAKTSIILVDNFVDEYLNNT